MSERRTDKDFYFGRIIGEGSFSTVYLVREVASGKEYAGMMKSITSERQRMFMNHFPLQ